jgi:hypothetical protein
MHKPLDSFDGWMGHPNINGFRIPTTHAAINVCSTRHSQPLSGLRQRQATAPAVPALWWTANPFFVSPVGRNNPLR